jgi:16S rRNA (adenine1518-N6/adenine1519-N6)-dimethyltransferase
MRKSEIRALLDRIGLIPQKNRGQNFLASERIAEQIVRAAEVNPRDLVVEIGPGLGMVTGKILGTGAHILAVEIDPLLASYLEERFGGHEHFHMIEHDFLSLAPETLYSYNGSRKPVFITNPPYRGGKKILKRLVTMERAKRIIITLQKEVAKTVLALPGSPKAAAITYIVHLRFSPRKLFDIPKNFFYPQPSINSTTLLLAPHHLKHPVKNDFFYCRTVEQLMHTKKKQLKNSIRANFNIPVKTIETMLAQLELTDSTRPSELTLEQMVTLVNSIESKCPA